MDSIKEDDMATRTPRKGRISEELLAGQDAAEVFRSGELIDDLKKAVAERALGRRDGQMDAHLEGEAARARRGTVLVPPAYREGDLRPDGCIEVDALRVRAGTGGAGG